MKCDLLGHFHFFLETQIDVGSGLISHRDYMALSFSLHSLQRTLSSQGLAPWDGSGPQGLFLWRDLTTWHVWSLCSILPGLRARTGPTMTPNLSPHAMHMHTHTHTLLSVPGKVDFAEGLG